MQSESVNAGQTIQSSKFEINAAASFNVLINFRAHSGDFCKITLS